MEMMQAMPRQNHVDVPPPIRRVRAGKNDSLRGHELGKMEREVLAGLNVLQQWPELRLAVRSCEGVMPRDHNFTVRGLAGMRRMRHVTKAKITRRVGITSKASREALLLGALGKTLIIESRNA